MKNELRTVGHFFSKSSRFPPYYWGRNMRTIWSSLTQSVKSKFSKFRCKISILWLHTFDIWDRSASVNHFSFLIATHSLTNSREIREGKNRKKKEHHIESHKSIIMVSRHHTMSSSVSSVIEFQISSEFWSKINTSIPWLMRLLVLGKKRLNQ